MIEKMKEIIATLNKWSYDYYVLDNPVVSDKEWDKLYDELQELEKESGIVLPDSPSNKVGGEVLSGFEKYYHKFQLYSLGKTTSKDGMRKFDGDIKKTEENPEYFVEYKYDGLTLILNYVNGNLVSASTRGNGIVGENVTQNAKTIRSLPLSIDYKGELIVRGECIMKLSELEKYNKKTDKPLKNARNAAAGGLRNLDTNETKARNLDIYFYDVIYIEDGDLIKTQQDAYKFLKENKFNVSDDPRVCKNIEEVIEEIDNIEKRKSTLDFLIDGAVVKINNIEKRDIIGYTAKFPKWALAYKYEAEEVSTILEDVIWQVGRTGKVTPIGIVESVELAGATIKKATLNNYNNIIKKGVKLNSRVFIRRSNEVIPEILGIAEEYSDSKEITKPKFCPCCNSELVEVGANLFCKNVKSCREQVVARLTHFVSRDAMNIDAVSEKTIGLMYDKLNVRSVADLYKIDREQMFMLDNFKDKKVDNYFANIEKSKNIDLPSFIFALGILNVGKKTAKELAKIFKTFDNFKSATFEELVDIKDIGEIVAQSIIDYFKFDENNQIIEELFNLGVKINEYEKVNNSNNILENKKFVITGTLQDISREEMTNIIESYGGQTSGSVSKNTDYVLYGESAGSKLTKAQNLGIKTITLEEFWQLVGKN